MQYYLQWSTLCRSYHWISSFIYSLFHAVWHWATQKNTYWEGKGHTGSIFKTSVAWSSCLKQCSTSNKQQHNQHQSCKASITDSAFRYHHYLIRGTKNLNLQHRRWERWYVWCHHRHIRCWHPLSCYKSCQQRRWWKSWHWCQLCGVRTWLWWRWDSPWEASWKCWGWIECAFDFVLLLLLLTLIPDQLAKDWTAPIYVFFKQMPRIDYVDSCQVHVFVCAASHCRGKNSHDVHQFLNTGDARSTSGLCYHAKMCWGEDTVSTADKTADLKEARHHQKWQIQVL